MKLLLIALLLMPLGACSSLSAHLEESIGQTLEDIRSGEVGRKEGLEDIKSELGEIRGGLLSELRERGQAGLTAGAGEAWRQFSLGKMFTPDGIFAVLSSIATGAFLIKRNSNRRDMSRIAQDLQPVRNQVLAPRDT